jgi:endonuclease/exonuclease/phosphatase (EEP) superfamily protein YafD
VGSELKLVKRDKEGHFILIKGAILQEEITIINLHAPNVSASNFIEHTLKDLKPHIDPNTVVVGDFNTPLSIIAKSSRQKTNKEILELNDTTEQMYLTDVYRIFPLTTAQYTFFSAAHGTFSKIDHILGHKASLNKYKKIKITPCILSDHNAIKLELNNKSSSRRYANNWRLNNMLLNDQWVIEEIREEIRKFLELVKMKTNLSEPMGHSKGSPKRKVYSHECIY